MKRTDCPADVVAELADRLEEGKALDVSDGAPHFGDDHVDVVATDFADPRLDLVGDVGDDLDRVAEIVAAPLLLDHRQIDRTGGHVGASAQVLAGEALVVAEIEVGLSPVVGDEDLAVLERVHRSGVDVDVRVELLVDDAETAGAKEATKRGGGDALAERGDDPTRDEHILGHGRPA